MKSSTIKLDKPIIKEDMFEEKTWEEFRSTGLLVFINSFLHIFGWSLAAIVESDPATGKPQTIAVVPGRTKFRGFSSDSVSNAHKKLAAYMVENAAILQQEANN